MSEQSEKHAPRREDGLFAYVVTKRSWGRSSDRLVWSLTLAIAKREFGWTREQHTTVAVRRATIADVEALS